VEAGESYAEVSVIRVDGLSIEAVVIGGRSGNKRAASVCSSGIELIGEVESRGSELVEGAWANRGVYDVFWS